MQTYFRRASGSYSSENNKQLYTSSNITYSSPLTGCILYYRWVDLILIVVKCIRSPAIIDDGVKLVPKFQNCISGSYFYWSCSLQRLRGASSSAGRSDLWIASIWCALVLPFAPFDGSVSWILHSGRLFTVLILISVRLVRCGRRFLPHSVIAKTAMTQWDFCWCPNPLPPPLRLSALLFVSMRLLFLFLWNGKWGSPDSRNIYAVL